MQKAKEDENRVVNEANAYAESVLPQARGQAQKQLEQANAYRDQVIARSEGEANRFTKLRTEYSRAKEVTRDRLYIDALESVLSRTNKVLVDVEGGNNIMYLPLDQMAKRSSGSVVDEDTIRRRTEDVIRNNNNRSDAARRSDPR